jgi:hypothetical protein
VQAYEGGAYEGGFTTARCPRSLRDHVVSPAMAWFEPEGTDGGVDREQCLEFTDFSSRRHIWETERNNSVDGRFMIVSAAAMMKL